MKYYQYKTFKKFDSQRIKDATKQSQPKYLRSLEAH